jgi:hypothetical protein
LFVADILEETIVRMTNQGDRQRITNQILISALFTDI